MGNTAEPPLHLHLMCYCIGHYVTGPMGGSWSISSLCIQEKTAQ